MGTSSAGTARYDRFVADLFGVMAYGELSAFERLSSDARYSPTLHDRAVLGRIAVIEFQHYELVSEKLAQMGVDVEDAMHPFQAAVDHFHERTRPADWYESLMKAYVVDTVSTDFYQAVARYVDAGTREVIQQIQSSEEATAVLRERLRGALADDPRLASRLALWGRRLLGEALTQAQRVGYEHAFMTQLITEADSSADDASARELVRTLTAELAENHAKRMVQLGLSS